VGPIPARGADGQGATVAPLVTLPPSPQLLRAPAALQGQVRVAATAPRIDFAVFPGQSEQARLWSSWGEAVFASDGKFYASLGDHDAPHGAAYVYAIDPAERTVQRVVDFNAQLKRTADQYTPGKIHCPLVEGYDQALYFFGYRGSVRHTTAAADYTGDWLLRYALDEGTTENLGIPVPFSSVPVLASTSNGESLYGLSVPGQTMPEPTSQFFHYDLRARKIVHRSAIFASGPRAIVVGFEDRAYFGTRDEASGEGRLVCYDPAKGELRQTRLKIPGDGMLRAASRVDKDGVAWCFSKDGVVFAFDTRREQIREVTRAFVAGRQYIAACRLGPRERYLYYVPDAHGRSGEVGSPVIQLDVRSGERKVLAFLNAYLREKQEYNLGGTYGLALNRDGSQLLINWNGARLPAGRQTEFGRCAAMVVHIPESERAP
jgi:sugar lactone lactonase YvrE